jgi:hypothetical protein
MGVAAKGRDSDSGIISDGTRRVGEGHFDDVVVLVPNFQSTLASIVINYWCVFFSPTLGLDIDVGSCVP